MPTREDPLLYAALGATGASNAWHLQIVIVSDTERRVVRLDIGAYWHMGLGATP